MPGILPMKVIKVGTSSQSRIAQACDRCRSKKIRCDGIRPCCSQCSNVGFECKTSDKLSRRAFPRGYTESLEERVRSLEGEVRELKDLLDEKDEKIEMLSKMHSNRRASSSASSMPPVEKHEPSPPREDIFRIQARPILGDPDSSQSVFVGASGNRSFVDAFKIKVQESGKSLPGVDTDTFFRNLDDTAYLCKSLPRNASIPPRMFSDRCVNVFFQEWTPLFPILHKTSFLGLYEEYAISPETMTNSHHLAQLHLVFAIAGLSFDSPDKRQIALCENQWRVSLNAVLMDHSMVTLQCLILASVYCITKGDYKGLSIYKGIAVSLALRFGLHQSQKRFPFGALTTEARKKAFWSLYTIDCFSAAVLGVPQLFKNDDIHCEYPADIDDEYVTEKGFLPTLPGEASKISSALALFRVSCILSKILERNYPSTASHDLSLQSLASLESELNEWSKSLPPHLKLTFVQDKPSTDITGNRSALLSLAYYFIRTLVHRPAVESNLGNKASSSVLALGDSSKHIIQIVQLLEERNMSFSFCLNKTEILTLCGMSILYQCLDIKQEGKLMKDGQRLTATVIKQLEKAGSSDATDFRRLATLILPVEARPVLTYRQPSQQKTNHQSADLSTSSRKSLGGQSKYSVLASASETDLLQQHEKLRLANHPNLANKKNNRSSMSVHHSESPRRSHESHRSSAPSLQPSSKIRTSSERSARPNLDYLSLSSTPIQTPSPSTQSRQSFIQTPAPCPSSTPASVLTPASNSLRNKMPSVTSDEWETILSSLDGGQSNIYDAVYGGPSLALHQVPSNSSDNSDIYSQGQSHHPQGLPQATLDSNTGQFWSSESWNMANLNMHDFDAGLGLDDAKAALSVLSFSEESISSGDDLGDYGGSAGVSGRQSLEYHLPLSLTSEGYLIGGIDNSLGV